MATERLLGSLLQHNVVALATLALSYIISICIYRRCFHPLAKIPGPFLSGVTKFYQTWYSHRFYLQIERLHQQYGPIVRITPDEIHLTNTESHEKIYSINAKAAFPKSPNFYNALCAPYSSFGAIQNDVHRVRRGAMNPIFSRMKVLELESVVQNKVSKVIARVGEDVSRNKPVDLHHAFRAVSVDVISEFAFDECYNFLDQDDIGETFFEMARGIGPALWVFQQFPQLQVLALKVPPWLAPYLSKPLAYVTSMQMECVRQIEGVKEKMAKQSRADDIGRPTIFTTLLTDDESKPEGYRVPTTMQLKDEAYSVLVAASDTTGNAMTVGTFHVLSNDEIYLRLSKELSDRFPDRTSELPFRELEKLPYLTAVVKESLRLSFGVIGRLPRVVPKGPGIHLHDYYLPPGTVVSMSAWMTHRDSNVFPDPLVFKPERWLIGGGRMFGGREGASKAARGDTGDLSGSSASNSDRFSNDTSNFHGMSGGKRGHCHQHARSHAERHTSITNRSSLEADSSIAASESVVGSAAIDADELDAERDRLFAMDRHLVAFGRGSRQCVGMPLAYCELYVMLGSFFRRFGLHSQVSRNPDAGTSRAHDRHAGNDSTSDALRVWSEATRDVIMDYEDYFSSYHPRSRRQDWLQVTGRT